VPANYISPPLTPSDLLVTLVTPTVLPLLQKQTITVADTATRRSRDQRPDNGQPTVMTAAPGSRQCAPLRRVGALLVERPRRDFVMGSPTPRWPRQSDRRREQQPARLRNQRPPSARRRDRQIKATPRDERAAARASPSASQSIRPAIHHHFYRIGLRGRAVAFALVR